MAFWSGETLGTRLDALIEGADEKDIDCNAYTLHMGARYYCTSDGKRPLRKRAKVHSLAPRETFVIPPGQFAFLETREKIIVPNNAMAFISIKATIKFSGLINVSGFHVDPGYRGILVFSVYNAGSQPIVLQEGMRLFLIWYADLDNPNAPSVVPPSAMVKEDGAKAISAELMNKMSGETLSIQSLAAEVASMQTQLRYFYSLLGAAGTVLLLVLAGVFLMPIQKWFDGVTGRTNELSAPQTTHPATQPTAPASTKP